MARYIFKASPQVDECRQSCQMIRTHPPLGVVIHIGDARPWDVRHNRPIGRETTLGPLGANLTPQRANHIHVSLGDEARSVIMLLGQLSPRVCVRLNSSLEHVGLAEMRSCRRMKVASRKVYPLSSSRLSDAGAFQYLAVVERPAMGGRMGSYQATILSLLRRPVLPTASPICPPAGDACSPVPLFR